MVLSKHFLERHHYRLNIYSLLFYLLALANLLSFGYFLTNNLVEYSFLASAGSGSSVCISHIQPFHISYKLNHFYTNSSIQRSFQVDDSRSFFHECHYCFGNYNSIWRYFLNCNPCYPNQKKRSFYCGRSYSVIDASYKQLN